MFHFPRFPPNSLCVQLPVTDHYQRGFPIQKSPDQRLFAASPKLIAGYHVFHRLLLPSHPPYALTYFDHPVSDLSIGKNRMAKLQYLFVLYTRNRSMPCTYNILITLYAFFRCQKDSPSRFREADTE